MKKVQRVFQKKQCVTKDAIWFGQREIEPNTPLQVYWGLRWAHFYLTNGEKLGRVLKSAVKYRVVEI